MECNLKKLLSTAIAVLLSISMANAAEIAEDLANSVVQNGEVLGSRPFMQPTLGWELLLRHEGDLYICSVAQETEYGYNGNPHVQIVKTKSCIRS